MTLVVDHRTDAHGRMSWAKFSPDRRFRFELGREVNPSGGGTIMWILLNPSVADADKGDRTVDRCMLWSATWGYRYAEVFNLSAYRDTDPRCLRSRDAWDYNYLNVSLIVARAREVDRVMCGWGANSAARPYASALVESLSSRGVALYCLQANPDGSPRHPLSRGRNRVPEDIKPVPWR